MKNKFIRFGALFFSMFMLFSASGCKDPANELGEVEIIESETVGTHDFTATATTYDLVKNGATTYKLVIPENTSTLINTAKEEFVTLFKDATGISIPVITDTDLEHSANATYISLGETALLESAAIEINKNTLGQDGVRIITKDKTVYLVGGSDWGSIYAVYDFMALNFHFESYYKDCYVIDKNVKNIKLKNFNVTDIPDIAERSPSNGIFYEMDDVAGDEYYAYRSRMVKSNAEILMPVHTEYDNPTSGKAQVHNTEEYIPPEYIPLEYRNEANPEEYTLKKLHPDWFGNNTVQLCYTAHGNESELELLVEECAKKIQNSLKIYLPDEYPDYQAISLTQEDGAAFCTCPYCDADFQKYGSYSGSIIKLVNRVNKKVHDWMALEENAKYRREEFEILFFAYNASASPPVTYNETKQKYEPIDNDVVLDEGVNVYLAYNQTNTCYSANINDECNKKVMYLTDGWYALAKKPYYLWTYAANYKQYMYFHDMYEFYYNGGLKYLADQGLKYIYVQSDSRQYYTTTAWYTLQAYLLSKLEWNTNLNVGELIDNYFEAMFMDAAPIMKELYTEVRLNTAKVYNDMGWTYKVGASIEKMAHSDYWSYSFVKGQLEKYDQALATIEKYKTTDPQTYTMLKNHIDTEWISPAWQMLSLHENNISDADAKALKARFKETAQRLRIKRTNENANGLLETYLKTI